MDNKFAVTMKFDMERDPLRDEKQQRMVRGDITVRAGTEGARAENERIIVIQACRNLAKANLLGASDPFVQIVWNGVVVGKTYTISNTIQPVWEKQVFYLQCPTEKTRQNNDADGTSRGCTLSIEVYDEAGNGAKGKFLGGLFFTKDNIEQFLDSPEPINSFLPLVAGKIRGAKIGTGAEISIFTTGTNFASIIEWQKDLDEKLRLEAIRIAEEEAERLELEYLREEQAKLDAEAAAIAAAEAAAKAIIDNENQRKADEAIAATLEAMRLFKEKAAKEEHSNEEK